MGVLLEKLRFGRFLKVADAPFLGLGETQLTDF